MKLANTPGASSHWPWCWANLEIFQRGKKYSLRRYWLTGSEWRHDRTGGRVNITDLIKGICTSNLVWKLFKVCLPARFSWPEFHCWCETARPCHSPWSGGARCHRQVRTEPLQSLPAESICLLIRQHCNILNMAGTTQHLTPHYNNLNEITSIGNCHHYHYSQAERAWAVYVLSKFWSWNSWPWLQLAALPEVGWSTKSTTFCSAKFKLQSLRKKLQNHHIKSYSELFKSSCFFPSSDFALKSFDLRGINWINYLKNWKWSSPHSDWKEFSHESIRTCCLVKSWALQAS